MGKFIVGASIGLLIGWFACTSVAYRSGLMDFADACKMAGMIPLRCSEAIRND